ncbi:MAG: beta-ketoacyl-ACP reductase [Rickettsiaceae bacterium]|nr:beta-ketoacyl-ACP reductase [Rickettsiaceae bacterium]
MIKSRLALVTGGTRGIGAATAIALKQNGYQVIVNYLVNDQLADNFSKEHGVFVKKWDVSNLEACKKALEEIEKDIGTVSILVNNAGITRDKMLHKMELSFWQDVINTNLSSQFNMCSAVINQMRNQSYGRIVNISSVNALTGQAGQCNYSAAKAGIIGFSKALARESANKNITVNVVAPGYTKTDMTNSMSPEILDSIVKTIPVGRMGTVDDISRAILFLVAEEASFITGHTLSVNGGMHMA